LTRGPQRCEPFAQMRVLFVSAAVCLDIRLAPAPKNHFLDALVILGKERFCGRPFTGIPCALDRIAVLALASRSAFSRAHCAASSSARNATESAHVMPPPEPAGQGHLPTA